MCNKIFFFVLYVTKSSICKKIIETKFPNPKCWYKYTLQSWGIKSWSNKDSTKIRFSYPWPDSPSTFFSFLGKEKKGYMEHCIYIKFIARRCLSFRIVRIMFKTLPLGILLFSSSNFTLMYVRPIKKCNRKQTNQIINFLAGRQFSYEVVENF